VEGEITPFEALTRNQSSIMAKTLVPVFELGFTEPDKVEERKRTVSFSAKVKNKELVEVPNLRKTSDNHVWQLPTFKKEF
jgi:hypothetical protein